MNTIHNPFPRFTIRSMIYNLWSRFITYGHDLQSVPTIYNQSINKTSIAPISPADRAKRRTNNLRDHV